MHRRAVGEEARARDAFRHIVVLRVRERFKLVRASFDRRRFQITRGVRVVGFDDAHMVEEKLVRARAAEDAFLEEHAHLGRRALVIVRHHFDDERHFVRCVAFEDDVLEHEFIVADTGALFDRALDHITRHALLPGFLHRGKEPGVRRHIGSAEFRRDGDFFDDFADRLTLFQVNDRALSVEPLTSHGERRAGGVTPHPAHSNPESVANSSFKPPRRAGRAIRQSVRRLH